MFDLHFLLGNNNNNVTYLARLLRLSNAPKHNSLLTDTLWLAVEDYQKLQGHITAESAEKCRTQKKVYKSA